MTKSELFKRMWVNINKRRPSYDAKAVLYKTSNGFFGISTGEEITKRYEEVKRGKVILGKPNVMTSYYITYWIEVIT